MKYSLCTNKPFPKGTIATQPNFIILSLFSNQLVNEQPHRWNLYFRNQTRNRSNINVIQYVKDSQKNKKVFINVSYLDSGKKHILTGYVQDMIFYDMSQLKDNFTRKYFLKIYIRPDSDTFHYSSLINKVEIQINSKFLSGPRFKYGYCGSLNTYRPCSLLNYIDSVNPFPVADNANPKSKCMLFDHKKGPFNSYCYTEGEVKFIF